jgi:hypothetical protein
MVLSKEIMLVYLLAWHLVAELVKHMDGLKGLMMEILMDQTP